MTKVRLTIRIEKRLLRSIRAIATRQQITVTELMTKWIQQELVERQRR
jgi:predicted DNA-binding ribbon-helix-helix protein